MRLLLLLFSASLLFQATAYAEAYKVKRGDTLSAIIAEHYSPEEIVLVASEIKKLKPGFVLKAGQNIDKAGDIYTLPLSVEQELRIFREEGSACVELLNHEKAVMPTLITGTIESSLFDTVLSIGEDAELAARLARIYEWEFDFFRDIQPGDSFTVLVEKTFVNGRYVGYGHILAADFIVKKKHRMAFFFNNNGKSGYFDENAHALERGFLRVPLSYSRISSRFTSSRRHPVTGNTRPHYGVDYAAPKGTAVFATASGTITKMTYDKASGNYIEIRHANNYRSYYMHLSRFNSRLRVGSSVNQGQTIGYVGSTGLSTGPHLDYRIKHNSSWLNPLTFIAESPKMEESLVETYKISMLKYAGMLAKPQQYAGHFKLQPMP